MWRLMMPEQQPSSETSTEKTPEILPILPLFDAALFPKMVLPLVVMQGESVQLVDEAMTKDRLIGLVVSKKNVDETISPQDSMFSIGSSALILKMAKTQDNRAQLLVQGISRFRILEFVEGKPYLQARVEMIPEKEANSTEIEAMTANIVQLFMRISELTPGMPPEIGAMAKSIPDPGTLADMVVSTINTTTEEKQKILEETDITQRLKEVIRLATHQLEIVELGNKIQSQVKGDMDKSQREYYLRQQLKAIRDELGEKDDSSVEVDDYRKKIDASNLPEDAKKEADRELNRLSRMHP
ncbi:MAG TPA: LON peptidase substrate-binding domain-containing protein, partial [Desulfatirhabdiaceae bacterium]|nr:LON peptidase substrate-binding domain-containing protein [Desulfatirhabdiaceae bacterium]